MNTLQMDVVMQVALAGFMATYAHLVVALWAPGLGLPRLDFPRWMADLCFAESYDGEGTAPYALGLIALHLNGIFFALVYAFLVGPLLPGVPLLRGLVYSGILLVVSQCFFIPVFARAGFFGRKIPGPTYLTGTMAHGVFGLVLGWLCPIVAT